MATHRPPDVSQRARRVPAYARYAEIYDLIGQRSFGERIAEATLAYLLAHDLHPKTALDLACGTGAATLVLAAAGIQVTGIDQSEPMLIQARSASEEAGLLVNWLQLDMRDVNVSEPVDLVTCFYDSINYLVSASDLETLFASVMRSIAPGGNFVFDLNTREKFASAWNDSCYIASDRDDLFGIYQSWFEPDTGLSPLVMTFFMRTLDGAWERFDEEHIERAYELNEVRDFLEMAGFDIRELFDYSDRSPRFGGPGNERSHRVVFVARRPLDSGASAGNQQ